MLSLYQSSAILTSLWAAYEQDDRRTLLPSWRNQIDRAIPEDWQTACLQIEIFPDESGGWTAGFYLPKDDRSVAKYFQTG